MTETITARLPDKLVRRVDAAVRKGAFPSRSEALRTILEEYLREHPQLFLTAELDIVLGDEVSDKELEKLGAKLFAGGKVARLVGEGRYR
jgi:Arc/MetJ-type ribon-helix-helix transcriptional regulator